jgi:hypothetical protein
MARGLKTPTAGGDVRSGSIADNLYFRIARPLSG